MLAQNFTKTAAHPVAHDSTAQRLADAHPKSVDTEAIGAEKNDEKRRGPALSLAVHSVKL
jgi:hypothetical protein